VDNKPDGHKTSAINYTQCLQAYGDTVERQPYWRELTRCRSMVYAWNGTRPAKTRRTWNEKSAGETDNPIAQLFNPVARLW